MTRVSRKRRLENRFNRIPVITGKITDVSTAEVIAFPIAKGFTLTEVQTCLEGAITIADATVTVKKNGTSLGTITITQSGSAALDVDTLTLTGTAVNDGDTLSIETDGGSTTAQSLGFVFTGIYSD